MNQEDFTFSPNLSRSTKFLKNLSEMIFSGCYAEKSAPLHSTQYTPTIRFKMDFCPDVCAELGEKINLWALYKKIGF